MGLFHGQQVADADIHRHCDSLPFDPVPVGFAALLELVVAGPVVDRSYELVGQILLPDPMAGIVVRIEIALLPLEASAVGVDVLQLARDGAGLALFDVRDCRVDGHDHGIGLRRGRQQDDGLSQRKSGLRQAELQRGIHAGLDDRNGLGIGQSDILAGRTEDAAAGAGQIAGLQKAGQIVQGSVRVGAAQGLHQGGDAVKVAVALAVVVHGGTLGDGLGVGKRDMDHAVVCGAGGEQDLHGVDRLADVAAAGRGKEAADAVLGPDRHVQLAFHITHGAFYGLLAGFGRQALNDDIVYVYQNRDGKFCVLGNEMFKCHTSPSGDTGAEATAAITTTFAIQCYDECPVPTYTGKLYLSEKTYVDCADGEIKTEVGE